jgi:hypothetical protein
MRHIALVCLVALVGCASTPAPRWVSTKTGAVQGSDEFILDEAQCRMMAVGAVPMPGTKERQTLEDIGDEGNAVMAQRRIKDACLRSRGWALTTPR